MPRSDRGCLAISGLLLAFLCMGFLSCVRTRDVAGESQGVSSQEPSLERAIYLLSAEKRVEIEKAIDLLSALQRYPRHETDLPRIHFLLGYGFWQLEQYLYAEHHFHESSQTFPLLRDYALFWKAQSQVQENRLSAAVKTLDHLIGSEPDSRFVDPARLLKAQTLLAAGEFRSALHAFRETERRAPGPSLLGQAKAWQGLGKGAETRKTLERLIQRACKEEVAREATQLLRGLGLTPRETRTLANRMFQCRHHDLALELYQEVWGKKPEPSQEFDRIRYGQILYSLRHFEEALTVFEALPNPAQPSLRADRLFWLAESASRLDLHTKAIQTYETFLAQFPRDRRRDESLFRLGLHYFSMGQYDQARDFFRQFRKLYPRHRFSEPSNWMEGWASYRKKDYDAAIQSWEILKGKRHLHAEWKVRLLYWIARSRENLHEHAEAQNLFQAVVVTYPYHYYGYAARARLLQQGMGVEYIPPLPADLRQQIPAFCESPGRPPGPITRFEGHQSWKKAFELSRLGFWSWASDELYRLQGQVRGTQELLELALAFQNLGNFERSAYIAAVHFEGELERPFNRASRIQPEQRLAIFTLAYPRAFCPLVQTTASQVGVPPSLAWAIMRQESHFKIHAVSRADARGLMQILPKTARVVAQDQSLPEEELFSPPTNVRIGTQYLAQLLHTYLFRTYLVAAAYNAGPERVNDWIKNGLDLEADEFIDNIPFRETRNYVKKVLRNQQVYLDLYVPSPLPHRLFSVGPTPAN